MIKYKYPLLFILSILMLFVDFYYPFILVVFLLVIFSGRKIKKININLDNKFIFFFIIYYFLTTIIGYLLGYTSVKNILEFILKFIIIPLIIYNCVPSESKDLNKIYKLLNNIIFIFALYGLVEFYLKFNFLANFMTIDNKIWLINMNNSFNYQPSSFFIHYNYYGIVLLIGWILNNFNTSENNTHKKIIYNIIYISQIILCQSRISWIAFIVILIYQYKGKNLIRLFMIFIALLLLIFSIGLFNDSISYYINWIFSEKINKIFVYGLEYGSFGQRVGTFMNWFSYCNTKPLLSIFGTGYNSISIVFLPLYSYFKGFPTADCQWTSILVETGIVGLFLMLLSIKRLLKNKRNEIEYIAILMFVIEFFTLDVFSNNIMLMLLYLFIFAMIKNQNNKEEINIKNE